MVGEANRLTAAAPVNAANPYNKLDQDRAAEEAAWMQSMNANLARNKPWTKPGPYTTTLRPQDEQAFASWVAANKVPFNPRDPIADYDMRGFWRGLQTGDPDAASAVDPNDNQMHFPDKWKTPYHETFSRQSLYAAPDAPDWLDDRYLVDRTGRVVFDDKRNPPPLDAPIRTAR